MNAMTHISTHAHQRINHLAQVVHLCFNNYFVQMLLTKTICIIMVYTCATQRLLDLSCMHIHSAVARDNDVCK